MNDRACLCIGTELVEALGPCKTFVGGQQSQILGIAQEDLGQELASRKQRNEDLDGTRVPGQVAKQGPTIVGALRKAFQVDQHPIWVCGVGERRQEKGENVRQRGSAVRCVGEAQQAAVCRAPVGKSDR